jgi:hypothetical protein
VLIYEAIGPTAAGEYVIAYPTPGIPHVLTAAGVCSDLRMAQDECARRNEAQVVERRVSMVRTRNMIVRDQELHHG